MSIPSTASLPPADIAVRPAGLRVFRLRTVIVSVIVAVIVAGAYPYMIMKIGFSVSTSLIPALLGYMMLGFTCKDFNRWENNIIMTAGRSAGATAFFCVLMAAFDMLRMNPALHFDFALTPFQSFLWLGTAGLLGVLLAVPMRRHFIVDEKLPFPGGLPAAEMLIALDARGKQARSSVSAMGIGTAVSAAQTVIRSDSRVLADHWYRIPETLHLGATGSALDFGIGWSFLSLGAGTLVGMRVGASMLFGSVLAWVVAPDFLLRHHAVAHLTRKEVLLWFMWPATGMLIAGGITSLFMRWKILIRSFKDLSATNLESGTFPMRWVALGSLACAIGLVAIQKSILGIPAWMTLVAVALSVPLLLVGIRALGETSWAPTSVLANMTQVIFGVIVPGHLVANMTSSGIAGAIVGEAEGLMEDFKVGDIIGNTPRDLTYAQLMAVPIGAATVSYVYPLLRATYGIGGENGLQSPISQKWAGLAQLLSRGFSALPPGAVEALAIAVVIGVILTLLESTRWKPYIPSPTSIGIGILVPSSAVTTMFIGGVLDYFWAKYGKKSWTEIRTPLASGLIAGEAVVAVVVPILVVLGLLQLQP